MTYTVFDDNQTRSGTARDVLEQIRAKAAIHNDEILRMSVDDYAQALIEDAPYFLTEEVIEVVNAQQYPDKYDRALALLTNMPTSGVRILRTS